ncbi:gliding motility protein [Patiriisocius marinus]|uniref:Gliding motility protein n=2 Tax=Patiriisocius marinus TaxID=1397112 RepID=A0A5J4IY22_9FLAO|nr:gliding motility protein [Patiriisocius marinus]
MLLAACGRKKDTFMNRNVQALTTKYNVMYNGENAFNTGREELALGYSDNYYEILPIERIEVLDEVQLDKSGKNPNFNRAEEKAVKAIQKHSMFIGGQEYNPQIDEAYMLLGKARYYDNRFIPALDAFNFILDKGATSNNVNNAKIWKAKTNIRLNNEDYAIASLTKMLKEEDLDDEVIADANAQLAQAMINLDSIPQALPYMVTASEYVKDNELKGRYAFIKGQIYNRLEKRDSANLAFDEVIDLNRKTARIYRINAFIAKAKNFDYTKEDQVAFLELLQDLEADRENRPFLDKIYNSLGDYYRNTKTDTLAIDYYNKSIGAFKEDRTLQANNYQTLAEMNFDKALYKNAGAYYDSTLTNLEEKTRRHRRVTKKRENLDDVIKYEDIATLNDSILKLSKMSKSEQLAFFTDYTDGLKKRAYEDSIAAVKAASKNGVPTNNEFFKPGGTSTNTSGGKFYFYNSSTVSFGKLSFEKTWGKRTLEDNWRRSERKDAGNFDQTDEQVEDVTPISENAFFDPQTYITAIPTDKKLLDSLAKDRDFAYYQLGLIYKEKFKEYDLASNRLENLLDFQPEERLVLPAKYNLYKIYGQTGNTSLEDKYKNDILSNHSDSRYAEILRNPNAQLATDESSPEFKYKALYKQFEDGNYNEVISKSDEYITLYNGNEIVPKFELLKATALGRRDGFDVYKKALNFVALTYPNDEEGKQAQLIYSTTIPSLEFKDFLADDKGSKFKLVYPFNANETGSIANFKTRLDNAIKYYKYDGYMFTSVDFYTTGQKFVVVHGLDSRVGAEGFGDILANPRAEASTHRITRNKFGISTENYAIIQIHKNLEAYLNSENKNP